jgi:hypothetical protein
MSLSGLKVFISSTMAEFALERQLLRTVLNDIYVDGFVFESDAGAGPDNAVRESLQRLEEADIYVGLFGVRYGEVTVAEFLRARQLNKPCLVYLKGSNVVREKKLEQFLNEHIREPFSGVVPHTFKVDTDIQSAVKRDLMNLLITSYRQSTRTFAHDPLQPFFKLGLDVEEWYESIGCTVVEAPHPVDGSMMDLMIEIEPRPAIMKGPTQRLAVRCISGRAERPHILAFLNSPSASRCDGMILISDRHISPGAIKEAKKHTNLEVLLIDELIFGNLSIDTYLDHLEAKIQELAVDEFYLSLGCWKEHPDSNEVERYPADPTPGVLSGIDEFVDIWLEDPEKEHLSVLGDFGMGKTWFVYHTAWKCLKEFRERRRAGRTCPRVPLVVPLRDYSTTGTAEGLISEFFFFNGQKIGIANYKMFEQLNRMGRLLLLFDGFDEMATRVDRQKMINHFWELAKLLKPGGKAILTCRTTHFPDARAGRELLGAELQSSVAKLTGEAPQFEIIHLEKFTESQIRTVLSKKSTPDMAQRILDNPDLKEMAARPLLTELILEAWPEVEEGRSVDLPRIYYYAVRRKMRRDIDENRTFTSMLDKLYFLCELSWEMLSTDNLSIHYREFPERIRRLFGEKVLRQPDLDHWQFDMMRQTLLVNDSRGYYSPAHRSLAEFFAAYKYVAELGLLADDLVDWSGNDAGAQSRSDGPIAVDDCPLPTWSQFLETLNTSFSNGGGLHQEFGRFATEPFDGSSQSKALVLIERLPRNALSFAAGMISRNADSLNHLCYLAKTYSSDRSPLVLLQFLKGNHSSALASNLAIESRDRPLKNGVAWVLGELGERNQDVKDALDRTIEAFASEQSDDSNSWWEAGFALWKLGFLKDYSSVSGNVVVDYLFKRLPGSPDVNDAIESLRRTVHADLLPEGRLNQRDIVILAYRRTEFCHEELYDDILSVVDLATDTVGWRSYYISWLCGHLGIVKSVPSLVSAVRNPGRSVGNCVCEALGKIGVVDENVVAALTSGLDSKYYRTRQHAAGALGVLGITDASPALAAAIRVEEVPAVKREFEWVYCKLAKIV